MNKINFKFEAKVWKYEGKGGWYFVTLPSEISSEIRSYSREYESGWGRLKCKALIHELQWDTLIWFDSKQQSYLLPLKSIIRKELNIKEGSILKVLLSI